jgi:hypothetical protein
MPMPAFWQLSPAAFAEICLPSEQPVREWPEEGAKFRFAVVF